MTRPAAHPTTTEEMWVTTELSPPAQLALITLSIKDERISLSAVKKAYRKLARRLHPDSGRGASGEEFLLVNEAYEILTRELDSLVTKTRTKPGSSA